MATLKLPLMVKNISTAYKAAEMLFNSAKIQADFDSNKRNELELASLKQSWGSTGSKLATGGAKVIKELEKDQKIRSTRLVRDYLDRALLDLATFYRDVLLLQSNSKTILINADNLDIITKFANSSTTSKTLSIIQSIFATRNNLARNASPLLALEALMCEVK
jgi:DNA polymerase-3 subunit delta'